LTTTDGDGALSASSGELTSETPVKIVAMSPDVRRDRIGIDIVYLIESCGTLQINLPTWRLKINACSDLKKEFPLFTRMAWVG
jgi:hypothetical protein